MLQNPFESHIDGTQQWWSESNRSINFRMMMCARSCYSMAFWKFQNSQIRRKLNFIFSFPSTVNSSTLLVGPLFYVSFAALFWITLWTPNSTSNIARWELFRAVCRKKKAKWFLIKIHHVQWSAAEWELKCSYMFVAILALKIMK